MTKAGDFGLVVPLCLLPDHFADAILLAVRSDPELLRRAHAKLLRTLNLPNYALLRGSKVSPLVTELERECVANPM